MRRGKIIAGSIFGFIVAIAAVGLGYIVVKLSTPIDVQDFSDIYVHYSEEDSISLATQIESNEKLLVILFHPECDFCQAEINGLQSLDMPELSVDLVSFAPKDSIDAFLKDMTFLNLSEVNVVYDSLLTWNNTIGSIGIPTMLYFKNGEFVCKRAGYTKLDQILYEE